MNRIVRKDTNLILARNTWSETESKLLASFITKLEPVIKSETNQQLKDLLPIEENYENIEFPEITITIQELEKLWGCKLNTTQIDKICIDLKTKIYILKEASSLSTKPIHIIFQSLLMIRIFIVL